MNSHFLKKCRILKETKHEWGNENNCQTHEDFKYGNCQGALKKKKKKTAFYVQRCKSGR